MLWEWRSIIGFRVLQTDIHCLFTGFGRREIVECLLEKGAQVDVKDEGMVPHCF